MRGLLMAAAVLMLAVPALAQEVRLRTDLAEDHVDITTGFDGAAITLYGVTGASGNIAVVIKGPDRTMIVRRKSQVMGTWVNNESVEFRRVPSYYDLALSTSEETLASPDVLHANGIGLGALDFYAEDDVPPSTIGRFREALIRNKQSEGLFSLKPRTIEFVDGNFFKVRFNLPSNVPTGLYTVSAFLIDDGRVLERRDVPLRVGQVGFSARVYSFAREQSLAYGLLAVFIALLAGWSAYTFLRRD